MTTENGAARDVGGWRVGDAGKTVYGPKKADGSLPEVVCSNIKGDRAHLIAAAPELYESCRAWEAYMTTHLIIGKNGKANAEVAVLIEAARLALTKARKGGGE